MSRSLRGRLERLRRRLPVKKPELPPIVAVLETGERIALINGDWIPWPEDRPVAPWTKLYLFDPRTI